MTQSFDVVVIGSGVAGKSIASGLAAADRTVAIIEEDLWGGTCPNRGCHPKKVLLSAVEARDKSAQMSGKGIEGKQIVYWPDLMAFKKTFTDPVPEQSKKSLESAGVTTITGSAEFIGKNTLQVEDTVIKGTQFVIATGARPFLLDIPGQEHFLTSDDFLSLQDMPDVITFIGGGYISFELAAIANAAGAEVHIVQHNDRPLRAYKQDYVEEVMKQLKNKGVTFHLNISITEIEKTDQGFRLTDDSDFDLTTDLVFGTTGRVPNIERLNLEQAGVAYGKIGIKVDDYLRTSDSSIFAIGDCVAKNQPNLTPVSSFEASYLLDYLTGESSEPIAYPSIPTIVFTSPRLAQIGVTEQEATKYQETFDVSTIDATKWFSYSRSNEPVSHVTIVTEKETGFLVGAACINNEADQLINYFSFLINQKIKADNLSDMIFAYPSIASDLPSIYS